MTKPDLLGYSHEMWNSIREWLKKNKVFFEVGNIVIFALMTSVLAVLSYRLQSESANHDLLTKLPDIRVSSRLRAVASGESHKDEDLTIENVGERLSAFNADVYSFIKLVYDDKSALVPVVYFVGSIPLGKPTGALQVSVQPNNRSEFGRLYQEAIAFVKLHRHLDFRVVTAVRVQYKDLFGQTHVQCFRGETLETFDEDTNCEFLNQARARTRDKIPVDIESVHIGDMVKAHF